MPNKPNRWNVATKRAVLVSTAAAIGFQAWYSAESHPYLLWTLLVVPVLTYLAGRRFPDTTAGIVMASGYLFPTVLILITGLQQFYFSVWAAILLTAIAGTLRPEWQSPSRLRFAMSAWGLTVGLTWPLVALREMDWTPGLLLAPPITRNPALHGIPTALWAAQIATTHLLGLIWVDWLLGRFRDGDVARFERRIVRPALAAAIAGALVAMYQGYVTLEFPRQSLWAAIGRASGALDDGNASGALLGLWVAVPIAMALGRARWQQAVLALLSIVLLLGLWQTQSRTALICAVIGLIGVGHATVVRSRARLRLAGLMLLAGVVAVALAAVAFRAGTQNTLSRMDEYVHFFNAGGVRQVARELWVRNGYGTAALQMIRDEPVQGVGVGGFSTLSGSYSKLISGTTLPADNAQNWFRHQIAELGTVGSLGVLAWSAAPLLALFARRKASGPVSAFARGATADKKAGHYEDGGAGADRDLTTVVKYMLGGFGVISLVGVPSLNLFVAMTVWTFCAWLFLRLASGDERYRVDAATTSRLPFAAASLIALVVTAFTAYAGWHSLRPPFRAARFDYPYTAGLYSPTDATPAETVTTRQAVVVPRAEAPLLKLTLWVDHPDADARPVLVEAWVNHKREVRGRFARNVPLTKYIPVPDGRRFVLETAVDRTFAADAQHPEIGVHLAWEFVTSRITQ